MPLCRRGLRRAWGLKGGPQTPLWCQAGTAEGGGAPAGVWTPGPPVRGGGRRAGRLRQP